MKDWKTTTQSILTVALSVLAVLLASPQSWMNAKVTAVLMAVSAVGKIVIGVLQKDGETSSGDSKIDLTKVAPVLLAVVLVLPLLTIATGCDSWERNTYNTLAATQKVINQARDDYRFAATATASQCSTRASLHQGGCIPNTPEAYAALNKASDVQTAAVEAFAAYERIKVVGTAADVQARQEELSKLIAQLPEIIKAVKALYLGGAR